MSQLRYLSVSEFNTIIGNIFKSEEMLFNITVLGEVSRIDVYGSHAYFTIKDEDAELQCTCFNHRKTYLPKCGESVLVTGSPNFYIKKGTLSFNIDRIRPAGQGLLYVKLEELKKKLREEGLFDEGKKKLIPQFPTDICVVTSINGAVIRDIVTTIRLRNNNINIKVYDVRVQGEDAAKTIMKALKDVDGRNYDLIILARGGGSLEDLMPFNDEELARTIFALKTPIVSAIGHETDFTIADFVADQRAATPTAAAEIIAYNVEEWRRNIIKKVDDMYCLLINLYRNYETKVRNSIDLISTKTMLHLERNYALTRELMGRCSDNMNNLYINKAHRIEKLVTALDANSPIKLLKSGYFRINKDNIPVYSVRQLQTDDTITVSGGDGQFSAKVVDIKGEKDEI